MIPQSYQNYNNQPQHRQMAGFGEADPTCTAPAVPGPFNVNPADYLECMRTRNIPVAPNVEWRAHLDRIVCELPGPVKEKLMAGNVKWIDHTLYVQRLYGTISGEQGHMFGEAQKIQSGKTNVENRKLPANSYFICAGIRLMTYAESGVTDEEALITAATWNQIIQDVPVPAPTAVTRRRTSFHVGLAQGEMDFVSNGRNILKSFPLAAFANVGDNSYGSLPNLVQLSSPALIHGEQEIAVTIKRPTFIPVANETLIRLELIGGFVQLAA